jgi:hypothetical protein
MPNYMLLLYAPEPSPAEQEERDAELPVWYELLDSLRDEGLLVANGRLDPPDSATTLRIREGEKDISDGPFAETKEILGGYFILECRDLDHALESAARVPLARAFREEWASILATLIRHVGNFQLAERRSPSRWRSAGSRAAGRRGRSRRARPG